MTFYRHFIERPQFEVFVVTTSPHVDDQPLPYQPIRISLPRWWLRICQTRLRPFLYPFQLLAGAWFFRKETLRQIKQFNPDAVFSVAGSWDWTTLAGMKVAKTLGIPFIASFNDWYDYGAFPAHNIFRPLIERRFRKLYKEADLALCTSEGMREALGEHRNVHIWYPTGAPIRDAEDNYEPKQSSQEKPMAVFFGGSLGDWYGPMMESLVLACQAEKDGIEFRIFGALETWSDDFNKWAKEEKIFRGRVDFETLRDEASKADLLILPMGFAKECEHVERTSFKTKFLDYLSFRRPILVWGPDYCSAVRVAREFDSAECVTDASPEACRQAIKRLADDPVRRNELTNNAMRMYQDRFHPDQIHQELVERISNTIADFHQREAR